MLPGNFVCCGMSPDVTFEVYIISFLEISGIDGRTKVQFNMRSDLNNDEIKFIL